MTAPKSLGRAVCHPDTSPRKGCALNDRLSLTWLEQPTCPHFSEPHFVDKAALAAIIWRSRPWGHAPQQAPGPEPCLLLSSSKASPSASETSFSLILLPQDIFIRDDGGAYHLEACLHDLPLEDKTWLCQESKHFSGQVTLTSTELSRFILNFKYYLKPQQGEKNLIVACREKSLGTGW